MKPVSRVVYQVWMGGSMSADRRACFEQGVRSIPVPVRLVTEDNLHEFVVREHPLHPAYRYLIPAHKADYLRVYIPHFHGGGYADIKWYTADNNWSQAFDILDHDPGVDVVGTRDDNVGGANPAYARPSIARDILVVCFMALRANTEFTTTWLGAAEAYLSVMQHRLERSATGLEPYPIPWVGIGLNVHAACRSVSVHRPHAISKALRSGWDRQVKYR